MLGCVAQLHRGKPVFLEAWPGAQIAKYFDCGLRGGQDRRWLTENFQK